MVTGCGAMARKMPMKSSRWNGSRRSTAFFRAWTSRAMIISRTIGMRSSPKNMCSVRTSPMPSAPNSRALVASAGVSALARTRVVARSRAHPRSVLNSPENVGSTSGCAPMITSPVAPFRVMTWPSRTTARPARKRWFSSSTTTSPAPTTQHLPQPRATTAACDVRPPREVSTPCAACMPATSSGDVSARTRMTFSSRRAISTAFSGSNTTLPTAAAGVAGRPLAIEVYLACGSTVLTSSWWSEAGSTRRSAVSRSIRFSRLAISTAMRTAAAPVRLPERVCKI